MSREQSGEPNTITTRCGHCGTIDGCTCPSKAKKPKCRKCGGRGYRRVDVGSSLDRMARCECRPDNRFYREAPAAPHAGSGGSYRDEFNTTADYDNGYRAAVRLATVLMEKHFPDATGWQPAPDLLGVVSQIDNMTADMVKVGSVYGLRGALAELEDAMSFNSTEKALYRVVDHAKAVALYQFVPACTCHPDDRGTGDCPRKYAASDCHVARHAVRDRFANDEAAKALYDTWADKPGWVPWVERGNSTMQERARREVAL